VPDLKLHSMKLTKKEREPSEVKSMAVDAPRYPYGLSINLDEDAIAKLDLDELPATDEVMILVARVDVTGTSSNETTGGGKRRSITLQITEMALGPNETGDKPKAQDVLYGKE
jgi:hypothetical protein